MGATHFVSPFAPTAFQKIGLPGGVRLLTAKTEMRYKNRLDLLVALFEDGAVPAGIFTKSSMPSAPVDFCRAALKKENPQAFALIVNAGQANAFTGKTGAKTCDDVAHFLAGALRCEKDEIYQASTGVIGAKFSGEILSGHAVNAIKQAGASESNDLLDAAKAIMTTDTFPKIAGEKVKIADHAVMISGIAKGSGMIAPNMGTMLAFIFTDAKISQAALQQLIAQIGEESFNAITVDGDTSTSDTLMIFATGKAGGAEITDPNDPRLSEFKTGLAKICKNLAIQIVKDGEGVSKFVTITVKNAENFLSARAIGLSIANSPLVKTALAGEDANWGRIVAAIGKSGQKADRDATSVKIGGVTIAENGEAVAGYDEAPVTAHMKTANIDIEVSVGAGEARATVYTTDLTHAYIDINADYRS